MRFLKEHLWPVLGLVITGAATLYGLVSEAQGLWTAGLHPMLWAAIGFSIFVCVVLVLFGRLYGRMDAQTNTVASQLVPELVPQSMGGGSVAARKVFQNEELRVWDLAERGEWLIKDKVFLQCIFYGPVVICIGRGTHFSQNALNTHDLEANLIEVAPDRDVMGVFGFENCRIEGCTFKMTGIIGAPEPLDKIRKSFLQRSD